MSVVRYEPWDVLNQLHRQINRVFDTQNSATGADDSSATADWIPPADIAEYKDRWVLKFDVPGVNASAIDITLENAVLTISGEREKESADGDASVVASSVHKVASIVASRCRIRSTQRTCVPPVVTESSKSRFRSSRKRSRDASKSRHTNPSHGDDGQAGTARCPACFCFELNKGCKGCVNKAADRLQCRRRRFVTNYITLKRV